MKLIADYHTHTVFSHGKGTVSDNIESAISKGLKEIGIADHSIRHFLYGVKKSQVGNYIECIEKAKKVYEGRIEVKTGIELNLYGSDGTADIPKGRNFDITILGFHKAVICKSARDNWTFFAGRYGHAEEITRAYMNAIQKNRINIIAHPGYVINVDYRMLGRACADYGTLFEINNRHKGLTAENIQEAASGGARFVLSSDAHDPKDVGNVPHAMELAVAAGLSEKQIVNIEIS